MKTPIDAASSWFEKANHEEDEFDRFVYLWFAFNILYSEHFDNNERQAIREYLRENWWAISNPDIILKSEDVDYFKNRIIKNCKIYNRQDTSEFAERLKNGQNSNRYRFEALMMILYQVRCNLFHGNKLFSSESDQEVVKHAANILEKVIYCWINEVSK